jgi:hypothetical protein
VASRNRSPAPASARSAYTISPTIPPIWTPRAPQNPLRSPQRMVSTLIGPGDALKTKPSRAPLMTITHLPFLWPGPSSLQRTPFPSGR